MQVSDLYTITEQSTHGEEFVFQVRLNPQHRLFAGHFPAQPVLPGVCTMAIVRACLSLVVGSRIRFSEIRECKFTSMVDPRLTSELEVRFTAHEGRMQGIVLNQENSVLKIKAQYISINV